MVSDSLDLVSCCLSVQDVLNSDRFLKSGLMVLDKVLDFLGGIGGKEDLYGKGGVRC